MTNNSEEKSLVRNRETILPSPIDCPYSQPARRSLRMERAMSWERKGRARKSQKLTSRGAKILEPI
jgi:hypothetical protein